MGRYDGRKEFEVKVWHVVVGALLLVTVGFGGCSVVADYTVSEGVRLGTINKFSIKGYVWKTCEGELTMAGLTASSASGANVWDFSVDRSMDTAKVKALTDKLEALAQKGGRVKIKYRQVFHGWWWRGDTDYYVLDAESGEETPEKK